MSLLVVSSLRVPSHSYYMSTLAGGCAESLPLGIYSAFHFRFWQALLNWMVRVIARLPSICCSFLPWLSTRDLVDPCISL